MPALAAMLIPLIPGLIQSVMSIIDTIRDHPSTPDAAKAQLDQISAQLDDVAGQVSAVQF